MDNIIETMVTIGGSLKLSDKKFSFISISCSVNSHHSISVQLPFSNLGNTSLENMMKHIGEDILITVKYKNHKIPGVLEYKGMVTSISYSNDNSFDPSIIISGADSSILLNDHEKCISFNEKSLKEIVEDTSKDYPLANLKINPAFKEKIDYCVQYRETTFNFINRMASKYAEWFYYNGSNLIFGKKETGNKSDLILGGNLSHFSFALQAIPMKDNSKAYNYLKAETFESKSQHDKITSIDTRLAETVKKQSEKLYPNMGNDFYSPKYSEKAKFEENEKLFKGLLASGIFVMSGSSTQLGIQLCSSVDIYSTSKTPGLENQKIKEGSFVITAITHSISNDGTYYNSFSAIPDKNIYPASSGPGNVSSASPQIAKVTDNKDTEKLGRVKLRFPWMDSTENTPWVRINNVHASKNRGFYFVPEIDDEVLVDFEGNDPDCPIVIGSLYNGKTKPDEWYDDKNEIKAIRTKSGNEIIIKDKPGSEQIEISNPKGTNNIVITMAENNKIKITSGGDIELKAKNKISLKSKQIEFIADNELDMKSQKMTSKANQTKISSDTSMDIEGGTSTKLKAGTSLNLEGGANAVLKGGTSLSMEGGGIASLKGGLVKIN